MCLVGDDGCINFIRLHQAKNDSIVSFCNYNNLFIKKTSHSTNYAFLFFVQATKELCGLNSVLYVKQYEIAVADSLGRIKLWDTRQKDKNKSTMTLAVYVLYLVKVILNILK